MRWRWPPENSCGKRSACSGRRPTSPSSSRTRSGISDRGCVPWMRIGRPMIAAHALARVQRRVGVLEDHLHVAPRRPQLRAAERGDVAAVELDPPRGQLGEPQQRAPQRRLAAARLADEAERLARLHLERDAVDCAHGGDVAPHHAVAAGRRSAGARRSRAAAGPRHRSIAARPAARSAASRRRGDRRRAWRSAAAAPTHVSKRCGQRSANAQPVGVAHAGAGLPPIAVSRCGRGRSSRAIEPSSPHV